MPRPCSVCVHKDLAAIDAELRSGTPFRKLAGRFGSSASALVRHKSEHLGGAKGAPAPVAATNRQASNAPERTKGARTGTKQKRPRATGRDLAQAETEKKCVALRIAGKAYREIADELGVPTTTAFDAVDRVLVRTREHADESAEAARAIEVARCDAIIASLWERATDPKMVQVLVPADTEVGVRAYDGQDKAADRVLKAMERRARLLGLDAPTQLPAVQVILSHPLAAMVWRVVGEALEPYADAKAAVAARLAALKAELGTKRLEGA